MEHDVIILYLIAGVSFTFALFNCILFALKHGKTMKPNNWVSSSQATELLAKQLVTWPLAEKNYKALEAVQVKSFDMGGFSIRAQFNPARIVSTGAKVDARSLKERTFG